MATQPVRMEYHPSGSWCLEVWNNFAKNPVTFPLMTTRVAFASQLTRCTGSILRGALLMSVLFNFGWSKSQFHQSQVIVKTDNTADENNWQFIAA